MSDTNKNIKLRTTITYDCGYYTIPKDVIIELPVHDIARALKDIKEELKELDNEENHN